MGSVQKKMRQLEKSFEAYDAIILTGGSSGIGSALIKAMRNINRSCLLINISRSKSDDFKGLEPFFHVTGDLETEAGVEGAVNEVRIILNDRNAGKWLLINNSGFGYFGPFPLPGMDHHERMIGLNVAAPVRLAAHFLPDLEKRGGGILNIASVAAYQPVPIMATYGATKAFLLHWSLALGAELKKKGICVTAVCPGPTESKFHARAGLKKGAKGIFDMSAEAVAEQALRGYARGRSIVVNGWHNQLAVWFSQHLPKSWQAPIAMKVLEGYRKQVEA